MQLCLNFTKLCCNAQRLQLHPLPQPQHSQTGGQPTGCNILKTIKTFSVSTIQLRGYHHHSKSTLTITAPLTEVWACYRASSRKLTNSVDTVSAALSSVLRHAPDTHNQLLQVRRRRCHILLPLAHCCALRVQAADIRRALGQRCSNKSSSKNRIQASE